MGGGDAAVHAKTGEEHDSLPNVKVSTSIACEVAGSGSPEFLTVGDAITLLPNTAEEVRHFVCDGRTEEFQEVPQAFFHYTAFASGGKELVCDLKGYEDESGSFVVMDPCVMRKPLISVTDLVSVVARPVVASVASVAVSKAT